MAPGTGTTSFNHLNSQAAVYTTTKKNFAASQTVSHSLVQVSYDDACLGWFGGPFTIGVDFLLEPRKGQGNSKEGQHPFFEFPLRNFEFPLHSFEFPLHNFELPFIFEKGRTLSTTFSGIL